MTTKSKTGAEEQAEKVARLEGIARELVRKHFGEGVVVRRGEEVDPETGEEYVELSLQVSGEPERILDVYDRWTDDWVRRTDVDDRGRIVLSLEGE